MQPLVREAHSLPEPHLVLSTEPLAQPPLSSRASSPSQRPTPYASMSAKLSPSAPAVPSLRRTRLQASQRKSSRHTLSISAWKRRAGSSLAFACNTVRSRRTCSDPGRLSPVVMPFLLRVSLSNQGSFPPPALPGIPGTTSPSATLPAQPAPRGGPVGVCSPPTGLPVLLPSPSSMRAAATTPAEPAGARVARFPAGGSLPRDTVGSASALPVSRPAQRSLALRPAWSPGRPRQPVPSECFRPCRYLHRPLRLLPAGATVSRAGFAPARGRCLSTAHRIEGGVSNGVRVLRYAPAGAGATQDEERAGTSSGAAPTRESQPGTAGISK